MKVYFISGLGANEAAFANLRLPGIQQVHLDWLAPGKQECMEDYAKRMSDRIPVDEIPVIVALSFGGMLSIEIAKLRPVKKIIMVSSAKTSKEIPPYFRIGKYMPLHRILPIKRIGANELVMKYVIGAKTNRQKRALRGLIESSKNGFNEWAINCVIHWKNKWVPDNVVHIHGTADKLLPYRYVKPHYTIKGGSHLMILTKPAEVSEIIMRELTS